MATQSAPNKPDLSSLRIDHSRRRAGRSGKLVLWLIAAVVFVLAASAGGYAYLHSAPKVVVAGAHSEDPGRPALLNASGYVTPRRRATVAAKITGRVTAVNVDEGMHVTENQVLATLDDSDARRALDSARADRDSTQASLADLQVQLQNALVELHRAQELQAAGVQSQETLDNTRTTADSLKARLAFTKIQVQGAEARIREAQQAVDNCVIRAPFTGIVVSKDAQVGEMVSPISAGGGFTRTGIATIVDMNSLEIEVDVNEAYIARVTAGQPVTATLNAYPDWQIPSRVRTVIPTADRQKATVKVRISFLKLDPRILPDMGVKVAFLGDAPPVNNAAPRVLVPSSAVHQEDGHSVVFLVRDGHIERRAVSLGQSRASDVEILAGVNQGDSVVVKGPASLRDGQAVEVQQP
jgi:RND family efflux transporter MFP subunit